MAVIILTSGTSWTVPVDFNPLNNAVFCIGGGGGGGGTSWAGTGFWTSGDGGGGGACSLSNNVLVYPNQSVTYQIGAGGAAGLGNVKNVAYGPVAGDTWFNGASFAAASVAAKGGTGGGNLGYNSPGGQASAGIGSIKYSGGSGYHGGQNVALAGSGGGAAGNNGNGNNASHGIGGYGDAGLGGAGGSSGNVGSNGTEIYGVGAGGGGGGGGGGGTYLGRVGGNYGAGSGGSSPSSINYDGAIGVQGVIVIFYVPRYPTIVCEIIG